MNGLPTPRQHELVSRIIEEHIRTAEPVSSKALEQSGHFEVRSATIRNEMADLEERGYLEQRHTSGGRVPTAKAYRLYVNGLVATEGVSIGLPLRRKLDEALNETELSDAESVNRTLARIVGAQSGNLVMASMSQRPEAYKFGFSNLVAFPEFREYERMMGVAAFFDQFDEMFERMHRSLWERHDSDVKVMIGTESPYKQVHDETVIVARYRLPRGHEGTLTLVGPMRMDYRKNLGLMTYAAQVANRIADHYRA